MNSFNTPNDPDPSSLSAHLCQLIDSKFTERLQQTFGSTSTPLTTKNSRVTDTTKHTASQFSELVPGQTDSGYGSVSSCQSGTNVDNTESLSQADSLFQSSQSSIIASPSCSNQVTDATQPYPDSGVVVDEVQSSSESCTKYQTKQLDKAQDGLLKMQQYFDDMKKRFKIEHAIGFRIGEEYVDIISGVNAKQLPCLREILAYLDGESLLR